MHAHVLGGATLRFLAVAAALATAIPARASNGMRLIGFGPIQVSMGGASVGAPLDATTTVTNPAGLSRLERSAVLAGTYLDPLVSYEARMGSGITADSGRNAMYVPTLGLVWPAGESLTLGAVTACMSPVGIAKDMFGGDALTAYLNRRVALAASYRIARGLSMGAAANLMYARLNYEWPGGRGMLVRDPQDTFGFGATVGLSYTPIEMITVGVAYESKSFFRDFRWNIPSHEVQDPSTGETVAVPGGTESLAFDQPQVATVGASVRPADGLLVAADVEWIDWSDTQGENEPAFDTSPSATGAQAWNMSWSDQVVLKLGAQYEVGPALRIRAGYEYGKTPVDASRAFENIAFPAIAEHHVTLGAGYSLSSLTVNVAGMYAPEAKLSGSNVAQGISSYETKLSQIAFELGVAYRF